MAVSEIAARSSRTSGSPVEFDNFPVDRGVALRASYVLRWWQFFSLATNIDRTCQNLQRTTEIAKRKRRVIRAQATRIINEADDILAKQQAPDIVAKQLSDVNAAIEPHILEEDADAEFEQVMEYDDEIASCLGSMKSFGKRLIDLKPVTSTRNVRELRRLYDDLQVHMRGLKVLGVGEDSYNTMLYPVLLRALPQEMVLNYHRSQPDLCTSSTDGSSSAGSAPEHQTAFTTLIRYFRRELESQERALEHRTNNSIDQQTEPIPRLFSELEGVGVSDTPEKLPDVQIMEQFTKGNKTVDGRYEVRLPEREDVAVGDNRSVSEESWHIEQKFENFMPDELDQRGRICSLNVTHDERHPLVLPRQHRHTKLLVHRAHRQLLHAGVKDISCNCPEGIGLFVDVRW
ncbi:hypothetical protein HPB50_026687 [Hyalomma asiaticum]|uniref:Uncharacterized protein n=1 Tax=Hyalomma asiaticum TaxID=266040 RepID=A0ACB7TV01_HYAAI|nr:hypothetical protein HPB50_026687 [Hyalomma asiaticum]